MFLHCRLDKERGLVRVDATGQHGRCHLENVVAQRSRVLRDCNRMEIHNAKGYIFAGVLKLGPLLHSAKVIAQMECSGGLDAGKNLPWPFSGL